MGVDGGVSDEMCLSLLMLVCVKSRNGKLRDKLGRKVAFCYIAGLLSSERNRQVVLAGARVST
jgi:hypothetical protein